MANVNVGHVVCPFTKQLAVVREDCRGKLYYYSQAGKVAPNLPQGQEWMRLNSRIWNKPGAPEGVTVTEIIRGAPPVVKIELAETREAANDPATHAANDASENVLTHQGANRQTQKPLTDTTTPQKESKKSALEYLWGN